jgi:hypothetical protein
MIVLSFHRKQQKSNKKRAYKLNSKAQNCYFKVKIGLKILTANFTKPTLAKSAD